MTQKIMFQFPGQGSQAVGMGGSLAEAFPVARAVFEEVNDALGEDLFRLMQDGPEDDLRLTRNAQPALFAASMAALAVLKEKTGKEISAMASFVAGHSLGEYSALAAAGTLAIGDAARLLRLRGDSMQDAVPAGEGAMAAILGTEEAVIDEITTEASAGGVIQLANDNAPGQIVVSGAAAAVDLAIEAAKARGIRRAIKLPVSAPFHCDMMQPAADAMAAALADADMKDSAVPVFCNVAAAPESNADALRANLVTQVTGRVRWRETLLAAQAAGAELVDPRPHAVGSLRETFARFPHLGPVVPAMGYGEDSQGLFALLAGVPLALVLLALRSAASERPSHTRPVCGRRQS